MKRLERIGLDAHPKKEGWVPNLVQFVIDQRVDLARLRKGLEPRWLKAYVWWVCSGASTYKALRWNIGSNQRAFVAEVSAGGEAREANGAYEEWLRHITPFNLFSLSDWELAERMTGEVAPGYECLPWFLACIFEERADLTCIEDAAFSLETAFSLLFWWVKWGHEEYPRVTWGLEHLLDFLMAAADRKADEERGAFWCSIVPDSNVSEWLLKRRSPGRAEVSWAVAQRSPDWAEIILSESYEHAHQLMHEADPGAPMLPRFLFFLYQSRHDLQAAYPVADETFCLDLMDWWFAHGAGEYVFSWSRKECAAFLVANSEFFDLSSIGQSKLCDFMSRLFLESGLVAADVTESRDKTTSSFGVNVVGFPGAVMGLGEDARLMGVVLERNQIPYSYIEAPISGPPSDLSTEVESRLAKNVHPCVILTLPPTEVLRVALESDGAIFEGSRYLIGAMPWELPLWPKKYSAVFDLVDEVWVQSEYVARAYRDSTDKPVVSMPMLVTAPEPTPRPKAVYGFDEQDFVFYAMFDGASWLMRKNPIAAVRAFVLAFPAHEFPRVRLLVKAMNVNATNPLWAEVLRLAGSDRRITLETRKLPRQELVDMMAACDCYVSLHRSEGFGRIIAEAMLLGQPVVVSAFSGNMDFCNEDTAYLVDGNMLALSDGEYPMADGQFWFDPDISKAAVALRQVFDDEVLRQRRSSAAQIFISAKYGLEAVASAQRCRFAELGFGVE